MLIKIGGNHESVIAAIKQKTAKVRKWSNRGQGQKQAYSILKAGKNKPVFMYYNVKISEDSANNVLNSRSPLF